MSIRLVLADDHTVVLEGLRALLSLEPDLEVVAVCTDGVEVVEAVHEHDPDVLVMDAAMPHTSGVEALEVLRDSGSEVPVIILSATLDDTTLLRCVELGVEGLVLKESAAGGLVESIRDVFEGQRSIPSLLSQRALDLLSAGGPEADEDGLTRREREIVLMVAAGSSNKRTAFDLGIAEGTVKLHLHNAFKKLGVANRVQLSLLARERGWM